jgi:ferredoxin/flavodoxin---NADP+ reductase
VTLNIAVVGAGPSGLYAAEALVAQTQVPVHVDVIDRLPVPFGLVRYGVAPDHLSIRSVKDKLAEVFLRPEVEFKGNIDVGSDITVDELRASYDAVILSYGASADRTLDIPGESLPGSIAATDFVAWYCGHPDRTDDEFTDLLGETTDAVVVGVGNVAIDVTRILAKDVQALESTDIPQHVLDSLAASSITDIHLLGRRGPAYASFTTKELRELGELDGIDIIVNSHDVELNDVDRAVLLENKTAARNVEVLREWSMRPRGNSNRRIHLHFWSRPMHIDGQDSVQRVHVERTVLDGDGRLMGTGEDFVLEAQMVVRSVGYRGTEMPGVPFDSRSGVIPHRDGRVMNGEIPEPGLYVAGWIKRGPTGIIGTNKKDAASTVASILQDFHDGVVISSGKSGITTSNMVNYEGWLAIDKAERELGKRRDRDRTTVHRRVELLTFAQEAHSQVST